MAELNGTAVDPSDLQSLALTNYGHFTSMRVENGRRVRGLSLHLARLVRDCKTMFDAQLAPDRVRELAGRLAPATGTAVVRVTVFDPALDLGHIGHDAEPHLLVTVRPAGDLPAPPLRAQSAVYVRDLPSVKSVGLLGSLYQRRQAQRAGFDDALFVDSQTLISEGGTWNIGFVQDGQVIWPDAPQLVGTTMELLQQAHPFAIRPVHLADLTGFDAAFATNVAIGVRAISQIDDVKLPEAHPVIGELQRKFAELPSEQL
ncbi:aminotransferase class IV family protein [Kitasatospora sp. NPDC098663]|uniref:aminotransferase class IV family protein n=1 Tax=Kitasatospora sp. NPDC098663 TaxID=3364096 RepID=UPI0038225354